MPTHYSCMHTHERFLHFILQVSQLLLLKSQLVTNLNKGLLQKRYLFIHRFTKLHV